MSDRDVRVACVPSGHPYVRHLLPVDGRGVVHLPDVVPAGRPVGQWWPPVVLDPAWIGAHADDFDVLHVHFGTESLPAGGLAAAIDALREVGRPLVHTVHDLSNPQLTDQTAHREALDLLVAHADALVTLSAGVADRLRRGWDRQAEVIAHPHVLPFDAPLPPRVRVPGEPLVVGLHLRDLRPNIAGAATTRLLVAALADLAGRGVAARAVVHVDREVRDPEQAREVVDLADASPQVRLVRSPRLGDRELEASLAGTDVAVLPYREGTHSGWLELCWDLGVTVAYPAGVGCYGDQHPGSPDVRPFDPGDPTALAETLASLAVLPPASVEQRRLRRRTQRAEVAARHEAVYRRLLPR